jgi:CDP-glucose 4,6-dehydratase
VLAPLHGYLLLAERLVLDGPSWGMGWNFGPALADAVPVRDVAARLAAHWGAGAHCEVASAAEVPHESPLLQLDSTLARTRLGWHPAWPLDEALRQVAAWERARLAGHDMRAMCRRQIDAYLSPLPSTPQR